MMYVGNPVIKAGVSNRTWHNYRVYEGVAFNF
jgi:hypothetical protein